MSPSELLGIFGGTFDPVHFGHLRLAEEAREQLKLSQVLWIPAGQPQLREAPQTPGAARLEMVRRAISQQPAFRLDDSEVLTQQPSYTVDTLRRLRQHYGVKKSLVLLLGADAFSRLEAWKEWQALFALAHIAVATRPGHTLKVGAGSTALDHEFTQRLASFDALKQAPAGAIVLFNITALDISATAIRHTIAHGNSPRYLAPSEVLDYIDQHSLYR
jgi:nicotinate-nucleotide adenylyltransferase